MVLFSHSFLKTDKNTTDPNSIYILLYPDYILKFSFEETQGGFPSATSSLQYQKEAILILFTKPNVHSDSNYNTDY